jgi:hypothetical protein
VRSLGWVAEAWQTGWVPASANQSDDRGAGPAFPKGGCVAAVRADGVDGARLRAQSLVSWLARVGWQMLVGKSWLAGVCWQKSAQSEFLPD